MMRSVGNKQESSAQDVRAYDLDTPELRVGQGTSRLRSYAFTVFFDNGSKGFTNYEAGVERITGYTADDYKREPALWHRMIHPADRSLVNEHIACIHSGEPIAVLEHRIFHKSGCVRHVRNTSVTRRDANGALLGYEGWISDITDQRTAEAERDALVKSLRHLVDCDEMTGLPNRRGFKAELDRLWKQARRNPFPISLLMVDVDHFKSVNDTYGHLVGDEVIKELAELFQSVVRDTDKVCRYVDRLHAHIGQHQIERLRVQGIHRFPTIGDRYHSMAIRRHDRGQHGENDPIIFRNKNVGQNTSET